MNHFFDPSSTSLKVCGVTLAEDAEKKDEADENQIDSKAIIEENVDADVPEDPMEEEAHEDYEQSNAGEANEAEPYDPNDIW